MQIVSKMESNSESNIEEKSSDKEKVASNDVDFNENLSKQCNGNTMTDVNKNIAKSESLELSDDATTVLKQNKSEGDLSETSENCELHISEGSDVECEKTENDKDSGKWNGEDKVKTDSNDSDQNDIKETETVDLDMAGNNSQETGKENKVHQALDTSDIGVVEGTKDTKNKQSESTNKANDMEIPVHGSDESPADDKMHLQEENAEMNSSENELLEHSKEKISETCSAEPSPDESGENSIESLKGEETNSVCHQNSKSNDETVSKHIEEESDDKGHDKKEKGTDEKNEGENIESEHGNSDSSNEKVSESNPDLTESEKDLKVEYGALDKDSKLENVSASENKDDKSREYSKEIIESGSSVDPESSIIQSSDNVDENVTESESKNDQSGEHSNEINESGSSVDPESISEMTQPSDNVDENVSDAESENDQSGKHSNDKNGSGASVDPQSRSETTQPSDNVGVEPNDSSDSILKENASKDSENSLEHTNDDSESAQRENESIIEAKKDIGTKVDTNLSESSTSVKQKINDDISKENQTLDSDQQVLEMQNADNQETEDSNVDRSQKDGVISETSQAEAQDHKEDDISEESASTEINATQSETVTEVLNENDGNGCDEMSKVERKVIDNDQSVQTDERELETSSTQTMVNESKDQSSETFAIEVGSMETQTVDQKVQCENKETETEHVQKTEVCDKETSISQPESAEQSVQTEAENLNSVQEEEVLQEEEKGDDAEASKQPTQTPSTEQAIQTDLQESISMMIQTEDQPTEKEQALEDETDMLKDELSEAKKMIRDLQAELAKSKASSNYMVTTLKCQLKKSQELHQAQRCQSDRQMGEVLAHLLFLEGQLKKDKTHIKFLLRQKDDIIQRQKCDIEELKNTNQRLIEAVREHYARKGKNGLSKEHSESLQNAEAEVPCSPKVKVKNRGAFGSVKDIIWKHRSSLDLSEAGMEIQGNLKKDRQYSSQENLFSLGRRSKEARESRDKKCKSIAGYPDHSLEYLIPEESELRDISLHGSASSLKKGQKSGRNVSWGSDNSDVNNSYNSNGHLMVTSPSQIMSAASMPMLNKNSNLDLVTKERPHSISSIESLSRENCSSLPGTPKMEEKVPHPVPQESSNPFKNLKTILKRKGSKMKNKKRTVSLSNSANPEYEEAMKKHFEKYEMS